MLTCNVVLNCATPAESSIGEAMDISFTRTKANNHDLAEDDTDHDALVATLTRCIHDCDCAAESAAMSEQLAAIRAELEPRPSLERVA